MNYSCCTPKNVSHDHSESDHDHSHTHIDTSIIEVIIGGIFLIIGFCLEKFDIISGLPIILVYCISYYFNSKEIIYETFTQILDKKFAFNIDLLMIFAAIGCFLLGNYAEGALLLFLFSLAHVLEHYSMGKATKAIKSLSNLAPKTATILKDQKQIEVKIESLLLNDKVIINPGEQIPVDGTVLEGISYVNQSPITGESVPVKKIAGDTVYAGSFNSESTLIVNTDKVYGDRIIDRVVKLVQESHINKATLETFTKSFEKRFVPLILILSLGIIFTPPLLGILTWSQSFYRGLTVLVAGSPCALALGAPSAIICGIAVAARKGVLIKGGLFLENLSSIKSFAFDKTGTLTVGELKVANVHTLNTRTEEEVLKIAASIEKHSTHPVARSIVKEAIARNLTLDNVENILNVPGKGISGLLNNKIIKIGTSDVLDNNDSLPEEISNIIQKYIQENKTVSIVTENDICIGIVALSDIPRENIKSILNAIKEINKCELYMLTGDNLAVANSIAKTVGIDNVYANLLPEEKVIKIQEIKDKHKSIAMVGDGINDAPGLALATMGIAIGGANSSGIALESADVILMGNELAKLPSILKLSKRTKNIIFQNIIIALSVITILAILSGFGLIGIGLAVLFHEGSTLVVILNSLRLLNYSE